MPDYLKADTRNLFSQAKAIFSSQQQAAGLTGASLTAALAKFDAFVENIASNQQLALTFNDAYDTKLLKRIETIAPSSLIRDHFVPNLIKNVSDGKGGYVAATVPLSARTLDAGTLRFATGTILTADPLSQRFVAGHEIEHAQYQQESARKQVAALNAAFNYIVTNSRPGAAPLDVSNQVVSLVDVYMFDEGRANLMAYNRMIAETSAQGTPFGNAQIQMIKGTPYSQYLLNSTETALAPGLRLQGNFLVVDDANIRASANNNRQYQTGFAGTATHNVTYAAAALGQLILRAGATRLQVDISKLSFHSSVTVDDFLKVAGKSIGVIGTYSVTVPGGIVKTITVTKDAAGEFQANVAAPPDLTGIADTASQALPSAPIDPSIDIETGRRLPPNLQTIRVGDRFVVADRLGRTAEVYRDRFGDIVTSTVQDGISKLTGKAGVSVETTYDAGRSVSTNIRINGNSLGIEFSDGMALLGSQLGYRLAGGGQLGGIIASSALKTAGDNFGDFLDGIVGRQSVQHALDDAFQTTGSETWRNLKSAGAGAISSYITAEIIRSLGVSGFAGELSNTAGGVLLGQIITNVANNVANPFAGINDLSLLGNAVGSLLGGKLASAVMSFGTVGGQIGASIGSSLGVIAAGELLKIGGVLGGPLGAAIGAFGGFIVGGLIGSLFGGTPRSGADVVWDPETGTFDVANAYRKHGGSKDAAIGMSRAVAETFNGVLSATGGKLFSPEAVQVGSYGMRKKDYTYRPGAATGSDAITMTFSGKDGASKLISYGVYQGLTDSDFRIAGGDIYVKRALYNSLSSASADAKGFSVEALTGNLELARQYGNYVASRQIVAEVFSERSGSGMAAETMLILAKAVDLGLTRRHASDWYGGFGYMMQEAGESPANVSFGFEYDTATDRISRAIKVGMYSVGDTIDTAGQTVITGSSGSDVIRLSAGSLLATSGSTNANLRVNGLAFDGAAAAIDVSATIDAGAGDDSVYTSDRGDNALGGAGNDTLVGGKLDDWLVGGDNDDRLFAGYVATTSFADTATSEINASLSADGGSGNYLDGGAGADRIYGSTGSDWLVGGDGVDQLYGGAGGDVLNGGKGNDGSFAAPGLRGGAGADQYIFNRGDGQDVYFDEAGVAGPGGFSGDSISASVKGRTAGSIAKNWAGGGEFTVDGSTKGGEDAIAFGEGITMFHLLLERSGTAQAPGMDLVIKVQRADGSWVPGDDQITVRDWFEGTRRIEWLRFANGEEIRLGDFTSFQRGTAGSDVIIGTSGNDFQYGDDGDDNMWGLAGNDWQVGGRGNDAVRGNDDNDVVLGGADNDIVLGGIGADTVMGDDGDDSVYGGAGSDLVVGGRGDDEVAGGAGDDVFKYSRGDGRDILYDEYAGSWELVWRDGVYTNGYAVDGSGRVTKGGAVYNNGSTWVGRYDYNEVGGLKSLYRLVPATDGATAVNSGTDTLEFGVGIDVQDLVFRQDGNDLRIAITRAGVGLDRFDEVADQIRIKDWYAAGANGRSVEKFEFVNTGEHLASAMTIVGGTDGADTLSAAAGTPAWITGGAGDDVITGTALADILSGNSGTDVLNGGAGNDVLFGGEGDDALAGGAGSDVLVGGAGLDTASYVGAAALTIFLDASQGTSTGEAAGDTFTSIENLTGSSNVDNLYGDAGSNVLDGGAGNDALYGGAGDDTYQLYVGGGSDTITDRVMNKTAVVAGAAGDDVLEIGEGLSFSNLVLSRVGNDLLVSIGATSDKITIKDHFASAEAVVETLVTADGATASLTSVLLSTTGTVAGTAAAEFLVGRADAADTLTGAAGNDVLSGASGDDVLRGGDGDDVLEGGAGSDTLDGGLDTISSGGVASAAGTGDTARYVGSSAAVSVNLATRSLSGGDAAGDVIIADSSNVSTIENLTGSAYGDTLVGDSRANVLVGLAGNDTLTGAAGDDVLVGGDGSDVISGGDGADNIDAGDGNDTSVHGDAGADVIAGGAGNDILYGDAGNDTIDGGSGNDTVDGGADNDVLGGGDGDDSLQGGAGDDKLAGGIGNDVLMGGDGADTLSGDQGDDNLQGGNGDDTYSLDPNSGGDMLTDANGINRIAITGVTREQVWLTRSGNDLRVGVIGGTTRLTVSGYFATSGATLMREIALGDASIFLKYAGPLIDAMTAASATPPASTSSISAAIVAVRDVAWWSGGKAAPSTADFATSTNEDTAKTGTLSVVDHDENVTAYAVAVQALNGTVTINATTGAWSYTPKANYNGSDSFVLSVRDADGQSAQAKASVTVIAVNDPPKFGTAPTLAVNENAANGTTLGTLTASDAEGQSFAFSIADLNSPFAISASGVLTVRDGTKLNYEASSTAVVNVVVSDGQASTTQAFTVTVRDVAEAPNAPVLGANPVARVSEPTSGAAAIAGTTIATFTASDPDGTTPTLRIKSAPAGVFVISGSALTFASTYVPNFETIAANATLVDRDGDGLREVEYTVDVESWDGALASTSATRVTVGIEDTNEAPTAIGFTSPTVTERDRPMLNAAVPAVSLGLLSVTDPDLAIAGESHVYTVADARFEIVNGNEIRLKAGQVLDYEGAAVESGTSKRYVDVAVTVKDRGGAGAFTKSLTQTKRIYVADADDYLYGTTGNDSGASALVGQSGRDIIDGLEGDDEINAGTGNDVLYGGNGADTLRGGLGSDTYNGGEGADTIIDESESVADVAEGGAGNDYISLGGGDDTLRGDAGDDRLWGGAGADLIEGGDGADRAYGEDGNDTLRGGAGDDYLSGGAGADRLEGGLNFDTADYSNDAAVTVDWDTPAANTGAAAGDVFVDIEGILGSSSNDVLLGRNAADDRLDGGGGNDELQGRGGQDTLVGGSGDDRLYGGAGHDVLDGGDGIDVLEGGADNDVLYGRDGADTLRGDAGVDRLEGGKGDDLLVGGAGSDTYVIRRGDGADRIDQTGAQSGDRDLLGFTDGLTNRNLWFEWNSGDVTISVLGSSGVDNSVRLLGYSALGRSNVESVIASDQQLKTKDLAIGMLATTMDRFVAAIGYRPTKQSQFDTLYADTSTKVDGLTFRQHWDNFWSANEAPTLAILNAAGWNSGWQEDQYNSNPYLIQVRLGDDQGQVPNLAFQVDEVAAEGSKVVDQQVFQSFTVNRPADDNGLGSIAVRTRANASGTRWLWIRTTDAGGLTSERWVPVTVAAVADAPSVSRAESPGGNAGSWIPVIVEAAVTDAEARVGGAETIAVIGVRKLPGELQFNKGYRRADGVWILSHGELTGLALLAPAGWSRDLTGNDALAFDVWSQEPSNGASVSTTVSVAVRINGAPATPVLTNDRIAENQPANSVVGQLTVNDPDRLENNPFNLDTSSIWSNESRWISTAGPLGGTVNALQTGQMDTENGGGAHSAGFQVDPSKAYKFSVYVRADSPANTNVYFGLSQGGFVENASSGADDVNPYFMYPVQNTLTVGKWYRLDGYVLPKGAGLVDPSAYGGIFDVATGAKVANATNVYRWNDTMPSTTVQGRFFNYYGDAQGYSTSWYQPVVEQLPTFTLTSGSNVSVDAAGVVRLTTSADYESKSTYPFTVVATDAGGLSSSISTGVTITNVNEAPVLTGPGFEWAKFSETGMGSRPANADVVVATIGVSDPDTAAGGVTLQLLPQSDYEEFFYIDQATRQIRFRPGQNFSYEAFRDSAAFGKGDFDNNGVTEAHIANLWVRATDGAISSNDILVRVSIEDVPEAPVNLRPDRTLSVNEDAGGQQGFAWMVADDPDGQTLSYSIVDGMDGGGRFSLRSDGLLIANGGYDFEAVKGYTIRVRASDPTGLSTTQDYWVAVNDVNERPNNLAVAAQNYFPETVGTGSQAGALIARFTMGDPDGPAPQLVLLSNPNGWFKVVGNDHLAFTDVNFSGEWLHGNMITPGNFGNFGVEGGYYYDRDNDGAREVKVATVRVAAQDASGALSDPFDYEVLIEDANEAPLVQPVGFTKPEDLLGMGQGLIGRMSWRDYDVSDQFRGRTFAITSGNDNSMFSIDGNGDIWLQGQFNYEARTNYTLGVTVTDAGGASSTNTATIYVTDVNEAPQPQLSYSVFNQHRTQYQFDPKDPDDTGGFVVKSVSSDNPDWRVTGSYNASTNRFIIDMNDPYAPWGGYSYANVYVTVADKNGNGASKTISFYTHVDGYRPKPGEHEPPVVLDLDGDGVELVPLATSNVRFDMDADGVADRTGWVGSDDAFLVFDRNNNGIVDNVNEFSFAADFEGSRSDLEGVRAYDSNRNGYFDREDSDFASFRLWRDANQDGVTQKGELITLEEAGIQGLRLELDETGAQVEGATDNVIFATSEAYQRNGSTLDVADVFLAYNSGAASQASQMAARTSTTSARRLTDGDDVRASQTPKVSLAGFHDAAFQATEAAEAKAIDDATARKSAAPASSPSEMKPQAAPSSTEQKPQAGVDRRSESSRDNPERADSVPAVSGVFKGANGSDDGSASGAAVTDARTAALSSAAVRAAAILRSAAPDRFAAFKDRRLAPRISDDRSGFAGADVRVEHLISAIAAFHEGAGAGAIDLAPAATFDHAMAQLAPAI